MNCQGTRIYHPHQQQIPILMHVAKNPFVNARGPSILAIYCLNQQSQHYTLTKQSQVPL